MLQGKIDGPDITMDSSHLGELAVWLGEGMIDWTKPIRVIANGKLVLEGPIERDARVALSQAARRNRNSGERRAETFRRSRRPTLH